MPVPPPPLAPAFISEADRAAEAATPAPVAPAGPAPGLEVELSETLLPALQPFLEATAAGHRGVAIVRELPERIRTLVGPRPVAVYWLSNLARDRAIRPSDLKGLVDLLRQGIETSGITAVFLEGAEYLTRIHGSDAVVAFLKELDRLAREHDARAWLHLTPGLLTAAELDRFVGDLKLPKPEGDAPEASASTRDSNSSGTGAPMPDSGSTGPTAPPPEGTPAESQAPPPDGGSTNPGAPSPEEAPGEPEAPPPDSGSTNSGAPPPEETPGEPEAPPTDSGSTEPPAAPSEEAPAEESTSPPQGDPTEPGDSPPEEAPGEPGASAPDNDSTGSSTSPSEPEAGAPPPEPPPP